MTLAQPVSTDEQQPGPGDGGESIPAEAHSSRILVIDDEPALRDLVRTALAEFGYEVIEAADGTTGIEMARKLLPDLILCDVRMREIDGYHALSVLRRDTNTASIPFILMTGLADNAGMRQGMELGADDYLSKPFSLDALQRAVDARLKKVQAVRQQAEKKLADLRDNISLMLPHELRTPLNGILAYGELLACDAASLPPAEVSEMGQVIQASGRRLERLVENFLIYAQIELLATDPKKISALRRARTENAAAVVERQARSEAASVRREADLVLELVEAPLNMSEEYFGRIAGELVQNAFKFSDCGSSVRVAMAEAGNYVCLSVKDHGRGFSTEHITRIGAYMQFDRKLNEQQGQGLGLVIAKRLVELHGGTMTVESERAAATTIVVKLPRASAPTAAKG